MFTLQVKELMYSFISTICTTIFIICLSHSIFLMYVATFVSFLTRPEKLWVPQFIYIKKTA